MFGLIAPDEFESAFRRWVGMVVPALAGDTVVAIDGKTSRRSGGKSKADASPLHLVSAFATGMGVVLGQTATAEKSNEITAIPELLAKLAIEGCVVTIDAMGTQTKIARTIRERGAHYVLCVKENHPNLRDSILFADIDPRGPLTPSSTHETTIKDHGRIEIRRCRAYAAIDRLYKSEDWQDLTSFAVVERIRTVGDHTSTERVFYISSLPADAGRIARAVRSHWEVENRLHWCLDVQFNEDQSRVRSGYRSRFLSCLCGSDRETPNCTLFLKFLSCLCGSDLRSCAAWPCWAFLSCLCGSDRPPRRRSIARHFLSCLCGSDPVPRRAPRPAAFLSCLCGSDPQHPTARDRREFLSCLCGSDRRGVGDPARGQFLSCLCGSDPWPVSNSTR